MKCLVNPDYDLYGNFDSDMASNLMIAFVKCDKTKRKCKSETEIE